MLIAYICFKENYKLIAIDLSKQQELDAHPKAMQQINFTWNLERDGNTQMFFIDEETKETVLDFSKVAVNPKTTGGRGSIWPPWGFSKIVSSKQRLKPWFFVAFKIIKRHIFPENVIEIPQIVQKLWRISLPILAIFIDFYQFFVFFDISLLQRN